MRILVTGGSGMLGRALVRRLSAGHRVSAVSKSGGGGAAVAACDLTDARQTARLFVEPPEMVIHTAAYSDVDGCERDPRLAYAANALAVRNLAGECRRLRVPLVHVSTDYVFDGRKASPYETDDPVFPINVYGLTKLHGEHFARTSPVHAVVRTSWLFGPGNEKNFVNAVLECLRKLGAADVLDDQEDAPTYVEDLSEALERIAVHLAGEAAAGREAAHTFHVCNRGSATRLAMTRRMNEVLGLGARVGRAQTGQVAGRAAMRPRYVVMSPRRYEEFFGCAMRPWEESLADYLKSLR